MDSRIINQPIPNTVLTTRSFQSLEITESTEEEGKLETGSLKLGGEFQFTSWMVAKSMST
jgi:hypothetical protein